MTIEHRYLHEVLWKLALSRNKMAFISGPRQVGKTTMARAYHDQYQQFAYCNWDELSVKKKWSKDPNLLVSDFDFSKIKDKRLLILDEIHKAKGWKGRLKGLFDTKSDLMNILVTGSAKLNVYKKGSDSLLGRYLNFRLHPFSVREVHQLNPLDPEEVEKSLFRDKPIPGIIQFEKLEQLLEFSGFPEPFLAKNKKVHTLWRKGRNEKIIKEDILDLTRIQEISQVEILTSLLPEKIGSPLSVQSLREDLSVSYDTISRWLSILKELYYFYDVSPYSKSIARAIKKEKKIYFYDWTQCEDDGARFENFIASHLLKACHYWEDVGEGDFQLHYLRDKEKNEVDFLVTKNKKPWFMVEAKNQQKTLTKASKVFQNQLNCPYIQVVMDRDVFQKIDSRTWIMGADYFLGHLV